LLDPSFGTNGIFEWSNGEDGQASSLALEPDGRVAVAGVNGSTLVVLRLLPNGSLDGAFGVGGVYVGPSVQNSQIGIARTGAGGFRVSAATADGCAIVGLTAGGALDAAFGEAGMAFVSSPAGTPVYCQSLALLSNGGLLVAGSDDEGVFVSRRLANGSPDPAFTADSAIADSMAVATSIIAAGDGKVLVAGLGEDGASIMRLLNSGERDIHFGDDGRTFIDLVSDSPTSPVIHDMAVRADESVFAVGGGWLGPFVVRLIGDDDGRSGES
jgi:uncharacterized delta-60 repeat protein